MARLPLSLEQEDLQSLERIARKDPRIAEMYRQMIQDQLSEPVNTDDPWQLFTLVDAYKERPATEYIVEGLLAVPSLNIVYGAPGTLKSFLIADLFTCVASGQPWLTCVDGTHGMKTAQEPVVWIDFDNGQLRTHDRFSALSRARELPESTPLNYYSMPSPWLNSRDKADMDALMQRIMTLGARLVCIDNLGCVIGNVDENSSEMTKVMSNFRQIAEATHAVIILIHHQRKSNGNGTVTRVGDSLRGHSSIEAALDLALLVERNKQNEVILVTPTKVRGDNVQPFAARFAYQNEENRLYSSRFYGEDSIAIQPDQFILWDQTMDKALEGRSMNQKELVSEVRKTCSNASIHKVRERINYRVEASELIASKRSKSNELVYSLPIPEQVNFDFQPLSDEIRNLPFLVGGAND